MIKFRLLTLLTFVLCSGSVLAQTGKITGFVTDSEGEPLPGVSIVIEGTVQGAQHPQMDTIKYLMWTRVYTHLRLLS